MSDPLAISRSNAIAARRGDAREVIGAGAAEGDATALAEEALRRFPASASYMEAARSLLPRGAASSSRTSRRPTPLAFARGEGCRLIDLDGNVFIDYCLAYGPAFLGYTPPRVIEAVRSQSERGNIFGGQHLGERALAEKVVQHVPGAELVLYGSGGSDAVHTALRIARATTGRPLIVKFEGHYHGWIDPVYVNVPGVRPQSGPPPFAVKHGVEGLEPPSDVLVCPWNDLDALKMILQRYGDRIAVVMMEPVPCNFGNYEPAAGYLQGARDATREHGCLLAFDEIITGFRLGLGGAQERYGVTPDLTMLAKAVASGYPLSLVASTRAALAPVIDGSVQHLGTYNGGAVPVAAALATINHLEEGGTALYAALDKQARALSDGLRAAAGSLGAPLVVNQVGSVIQLLWAPKEPVRAYSDAWEADPVPVAQFARHLLDEGVHALERGLWFVSTEHGAGEIDYTIDAARRALACVMDEQEVLLT